MQRLCRNNYIDETALKRLLAIILVALMLTGCARSAGDSKEPISDEPRVDFQKLKSQNSDIFAWINVPGTTIDYPVLQSGEGDDSFYQTHNYLGKEDPKGAIYTECANLTNMCDFNEVLHGSSPSDGTMFADLQKFLDKKFFDEHEFIYVYIEGNAMVYYVYAAYTRNDSRLLETYDFTNAYGCQAFLDEVDQGKSMKKMLRTGWEGMVKPENFLITLTSQNTDDPSRQTVVVGCLVGDVAGTIDREVDYSDPDMDW